MNKHDRLIAGLIMAMVASIVLLQVGIHHGRVLADEGVPTIGAQAAVIDLLKQQLTEARHDAAIEREKLAIILCESNVRHTGVWGDGGKSYGIAQFQLATFNDLRAEAGRPELRWKDRDDQLWLLDWALRHGYAEYWTCSTKRRGENS